MGKPTLQEQVSVTKQVSVLNRITLHHLKHYAQAQQHFEASESMNPKEKTLATWLRKNAEKIPKGKERLRQGVM
jgi:DNA-binding transcriptional regulator/RsmH inhibitor MraZ